jgi:hypothetical protein
VAELIYNSVSCTVDAPIFFIAFERNVMMNRNLRSTVILLGTLAFIVMFAELAQAQQQRRFRGFFGDTFSVGMALLQSEKVQAELNLNSDQIKNATEIGDRLSEDRREIFSGLSREERRERRNELRKKIAELAKTAAMTIVESLDDAQKKRWLEITLQVRGPAALPGEYLAKHLELDEGQIKKLNDLTVKQQEKMSETFRQSQNQDLTREERAEKFTALVDETNKQRLAILSDEQKVAFKEMQGEKFELPED